MAHDIVIRNGIVIDGTGAQGVAADVAIDGDRISHVGEVVGEAAGSEPNRFRLGRHGVLPAPRA